MARSVLNKNDRKSYLPSEKEQLTELHKQRRLTWALLHANFPSWDDVIFSDESCISCNEHGELRVRRPRGTRYEQKYIALLRRSGRTSVSVWEFMTRQGLSGLVRIQGHLTGILYVRILQQNLLPYLANNPRSLFQQDFSAIHTSRVATQFYQQNNIAIMPWEPKIQDLNHIGK